VMVIACCDSRVCPTLLMGLEPGEVFTMRNVANLIPPYEREGRYHGTSAALEFAVTGLQVEHIIVLGHKNCGGIRALMTRSDFSSDFIGSWMKIALPAKDHTLELLHNHPLEEQCSYCERVCFFFSLD
jgi:carbonic anhydrase